MKLGAFGDTHDCQDEDIKAVVVDEFIPRAVEVIVHTGDLFIQHVKPELYSGFQVNAVLTTNQANDPKFSLSPTDWRFVRPGYHQDPPKFIGNYTDPRANADLKELIDFLQHQRIYNRIIPITYNGVTIWIYCGHERSFDVLVNPQNVSDFFARVNQVRDGVRLAFTGHTHHQFVYRHGNVTWVNPGSIVDSWSHTKEFATVDTSNWEVVLGRLSNFEAKIEPVTVGIISDTGNVDQLDRGFWNRLVAEFNKRGVTHVICCGNFLPNDIGRKEFNHFQVYYYLLPGHYDNPHKPHNWHLLSYEHPVVEIGGHKFYVQHEIGPEYANFSEIESKKSFSKLLSEYKHLDFIVAGLVPGTILQETDSYVFINPGDARDHKYFATVCLPRREYTVGTVGS